jgi:hypothetical protein
MDSHEYQVVIVYDDGREVLCGHSTCDRDRALQEFQVQSENAGYRSGEVQLRMRRLSPWRTVRVAERQGIFASTC